MGIHRNPAPPTEEITMRSKQRSDMPAVEEIPLIAVGFVVATVAMATATALLWTVRGVLRVTGLDRPSATVRRRTA
jgi:hypothetical protein